jgi:hypothetical protein
MTSERHHHFFPGSSVDGLYAVVERAQRRILECSVERISIFPISNPFAGSSRTQT